MLIGEPELTGLGLGLRVIRAFTQELRAARPELRRMLIDPAPGNTRAIHSYARAGFLPIAVLDSEDGPVYLKGLDLSTDP